MEKECVQSEPGMPRRSAGDQSETDLKILPQKIRVANLEAESTADLQLKTSFT